VRTDLWADAYSAAYDQHALTNQAKRTKRRLADRKRRAKKPGSALSDDQRVFVDLARGRAKSKASVIELRWNRGFIWHGGPVGGNHTYQRQPFVHKGFISDQHPLLKLYVASTRRAAHLRTGATKAESEKTDSKLLALDEPYCETNKLMRRVLRVELDTVFESWSALEQALSSLGVPRANIMTGHQDQAGQIHRPHIFWLVADAVAFTPRSSKKHRGLFHAVLRSLTAELLPSGSDPGGLSNLDRHKSPVSPLWSRAIGAQEPYSLASLQTALPLSYASAKLSDAVRPAVTELMADHPDPAVAAQSNAVFRVLAPFARTQVRWFRDEKNGSLQEFAAELTLEALRLCGSSERAEKGACATAMAVAQWSWDNVINRPGRVACSTTEEVRQRQASGARAGAANRRASNEDVVVSAALRLRAQAGCAPTQAAVLAECRAHGIRGEKTIRRYWPAVLSSYVDEPVNQSGHVKKDSSATTLPDHSFSPDDNPEELTRSLVQGRDGMALSAAWDQRVEREAKEAERQRARAEERERRGLPPEPEQERERQRQSRGLVGQVRSHSLLRFITAYNAIIDDRMTRGEHHHPQPR